MTSANAPIGLNIDDFHHEIRVAESYLQSANDRLVNRRSIDEQQTIVPSSIPRGSREFGENDKLTQERRSDILRKFGREPLETRRSLSRERDEYTRGVTDEQSRSTVGESLSSRATSSNRVQAWTSTSNSSAAYEESLALNRLRDETKRSVHRNPSTISARDEDEQGDVYVEDVDEDSLDDGDNGDANSGTLFFASDLRNSGSSQLSTPRSSQALYDNSPGLSPRSSNYANSGKGLSSTRPATAGNKTFAPGSTMKSRPTTSTTVRPVSASRGVNHGSNVKTPSQSSGARPRPTSAPRYNVNRSTDISGNSSHDQSTAAKKTPTASRYDRLLQQPAHKRSQPPAEPTHNVPVRSREEILERVEHMRREHEHKLAVREKQKLDFEKMELMQCTFKPAISKGTEQILRAKHELNESAAMYDGSAEHSRSHGHAVYRSSADGLAEYLEEDVVERLTRKAKEKEEMSLIAAKILREEELAPCTFKPAVNPATSAAFDDLEYVPIHKRVGEVQRERINNITRLQMEVEGEAQARNTFAPKIDAQSRFLAEKRLHQLTGGAGSGGDESVVSDDGHVIDVQTFMDGQEPPKRRVATESYENLLLAHPSNIGQRMIEEGKLIEKKKMELVREREEQRAAEMAQAKPSRGSEVIAKSNPVVGASFEERQAHYESRAKAKAKEVQRQELETLNQWYVPKLADKTEHLLAKKQPNLLHETAEERAHRMSKLTLDEREAARKERERARDSQFKFKPEIDPLSKELGRPANIQELVENTRGKRAKEEVRRKVEETYDAQCTFQPAINNYVVPSEGSACSRQHRVVGWNEYESASRQCGLDQYMPAENQSGNVPRVGGEIQATINLKMPEKTAREIKLKEIEKEEKRRQELLAREIEEMRECTFQPAVNSSYIRPSGYSEYGQPVIVRGLSRHMELQHLTAKKKEEALKREQIAFGVKNASKFRRPDDGTTIVKPFTFHEAKKGPSRAVRELEQANSKDLTFQPKTNVHRPSVGVQSPRRLR